MFGGEGGANKYENAVRMNQYLLVSTISISGVNNIAFVLAILHLFCLAFVLLEFEAHWRRADPEPGLLGPVRRRPEGAC